MRIFFLIQACLIGSDCPEWVECGQLALIDNVPIDKMIDLSEQPVSSKCSN
jgi:hypothetical protein